MSYPPPPWNLQGFAYVSLQLIDFEQADLHIPSHLELVSVLPGYTVGGIYLSHYGANSALSYSELIVVPGIVRSGNALGAWISHIYVDNSDSVAGGQQIWGLPKQLAEFHWHRDRTRVTVQQADRLLCSLEINWQLPLWQQPFTGTVFSQLQTTLMQFVGQASFRAHLTSAQLTLSTTAPFANLSLDRPSMVVGCHDLALLVNAPVQSNS